MEKKQEFSFEMLYPGDVRTGWSQSLEIVFVLQGSGWLRMERNENEYTIHEGDIFAVNGFQMRSIILKEGALAIALSISPEFITSFSPETPMPRVDCRSFLYGKKEQQVFDRLRADFAKAFRAQYKNESELPLHMRGKIVALLDHLFQDFMEKETDESAKSGLERISQAVDYVQRHYAENITLSQLAEQTCMSTSHLSHSFVKYLGVNFTGYLTQVRLMHATAMLRGEKTITEIAYTCGFASANAFIEFFKQAEGMTPGQYRRTLQKTNTDKALNESRTEEGFFTAFSSLLRYADRPEEQMETTLSVPREIMADIRNAQRGIRHKWRRLMNVGYAKDLLDGSLQAQVRYMQERIGFSYLRCKGLLDDDMLLYREDMQGKRSLNFVYMDAVIDFILSCDAKPMLEFGHMPELLAKYRRRFSYRASMISPPADIAQWHDFIVTIVEHLVGRYGVSEMRQWLIAPWFTPDLSLFGEFTMEEYMDTYEASYRAIKETCEDLVVCGAGSGFSDGEFAAAFLDECVDRGCVPEILTFHAFAEVMPGEEQTALKLVENNESLYMAVSEDEDYLANNLSRIRELLREKGMENMPILLDEWSNNVWQRDLCNDTCYKSAYVFKSVLENSEYLGGMGYFSISDQLDEIAPSAELFHGGFGIFTRSGLPKSVFRAFELLNKAGDRLVCQGEGYFITETDVEVQIFLYNYCHYDMLYRYRHTVKLKKTDRYKVFNEGKSLAYHIRLEGFVNDRHTIRRYSISPKGGSVYDAWVDMGAPEQLTKEEEERLHSLSHPVYSVETQMGEAKVSLNTTLIPHEVQLITISK